MKTKTRMTFEKVRHDQSNDVHCVVSLQAPKLEWEKKRPPLCIINVVDVSGSMSGDKLHFAKQSVLKLIDHLKPGDWCGLVTFESNVNPVFEPREMTQAQKETLKGKVGALQPMGCTNFSGGMMQALDWAKQIDLPDKVQTRVIMFTDGHANQGVATDLEGLSKLLKANKGRASLSAFGYGIEADQDLLAELAKVGGGNYAFVRNPEDALTAFARELGGLLSTYATDIEVEVQPRNGHKITDVLSDVDSEEAGKGIKVKVPNLYSEEELHLVVAMTLSEQSKALPRKMNVADVSVTFKVVSEEGELNTKTIEDKAQVRFVKSGEEQTDPTKEVDEIVSLAQLVRAQIKAEEQANVGNYAGAMSIMHVASVGLREKGLENYAMVAEGLGEMVSCLDNYSDSVGYRGSSKQLGTRAVSLSCADSNAAQDFANLGVSASNSAQDEVVRSFTSAGPVKHPKPDPKANVCVSNDPSALLAGAYPKPQHVHTDVSVNPGGSSAKSVLPASSLNKSRSSRW